MFIREFDDIYEGEVTEDDLGPLIPARLKNQGTFHRDRCRLREHKLLLAVLKDQDTAYMKDATAFADEMEEKAGKGLVDRLNDRTYRKKYRKICGRLSIFLKP
jgi:hypothetical protein